MRALFMVVTLASLSAFAAPQSRQCSGLLKREETKAFGGRVTVLPISWTLTFDETTSSLAIKSDAVNVKGALLNGVLKIENQEDRGSLKLVSVDSDDRTIDDEFFEVTLTQLNSSNLTVSQSSGLIRCTK